MSQLKDIELREILESVVISGTALGRNKKGEFDTEKNYLAKKNHTIEEATQTILDLFTTHTNQLIDELLSELPTSNCQRHWADDKGKDCTCDLISRDQVTAILEKKKEEI